MPFARRAIVLMSAVLTVAAAPAAQAADPLSIEPAIGRGVAQLESVQLPDGGFGARLPVRDSAAAGEALRLARPESAALARIDAFLSGRSLDDVDSLARAALGSPLPRYATALLAQRNDDGGFGLSRQYQSDALDTALGLRALTAAGERDAARAALDRLLKFASAGVWGTEDPEISLTSEALLAIDAYTRRYGSTTAIDALLAQVITRLGDAQQPEGNWSGGPVAVRNTALPMTALAGFPAAVGRVSAGADALLSAQLPDGSWGDPFSTALAIRALHRANEAIERDRNAQLADPSVRARDISADPQSVDSGKPVTIKATVTNAGVATASGVTAELFLDDPASGAEPVSSIDVPDIAPGEQAVVDATFPVTKPRGRARAHVVLRSPVGEDRDLANNSGFINLFVRTARNTYKRTRDWPRPGRDMQHSGATPNRLHPGVEAEPIWRAPADGQHTVAEGNVYFGEDGRITARDAKTGEFKWQRGGSYQDDRYRAPIYNRGFVWTATEGQAGPLTARTGEPMGGIGGWGGDRPIFMAEIIPVEGAHDPVFFDRANTSSINSGQINRGDDGMCHFWPYRDPSGSPWNDHTWEGKSSFYPPDWNPGDGNLFFRHSCDGEPYAFSGDDSRAFFASGNWVSGFDPAHAKGPNGEPMTPLFSAKVDGLSRAPKAPLVDSLNQVVVAGWEGTELRPRDNYWTPKFSHTGKGTVAAVDPATGEVYWTFTTDTRLDGSPVEYKGTIVVVDRSGRVYALDQITGQLKWDWTPEGYDAPPVDQQGESGQTLALSGRYLYVPHPDGNLYTLDARDGSALSATPFPARPYDLAIDDTNNAVYVRTLDGFVGAYATRELPDQCAPDPANAPPAPGPIDRLSLEADGSQSTGPVVADERPAMSADGRVVAYAREHGAPTYQTDIRIRDLDSGETTTIPAFEQVSANIIRRNPHMPMLSADGRYLGFLARQSDNRHGDVYNMLLVLDRETGVVESVLRKPDGTPEYGIAVDGWQRASSWWENPGVSMSGDGSTFAFVSNANNIVPGATDTDTAPDVFVVNRVTGQRWMASRKRTTSTYNEGNYGPQLTHDGSLVVFTSGESLTGAAVSPGSHDGNNPYTHLYEPATDTLTPVKNPETGLVVNSNSPDISSDGRFVTFNSMAPNLYPEAMREWDPWWSGRSTDAFVWDRSRGTVDFVSPNDSGLHARYAQNTKPSVSDDGQYVAFQSEGLFVKGATHLYQDQIVARDRTAGTTRQISHNSWGVSGSGESFSPIVSPDGSRVLFVSTATDLVDGDTNNGRDLFVYEPVRAGQEPADPTEPDLTNCPVGGGDEPEGYSDLSVRAEDVETGALEQGQPGKIDVTVSNDGGAASEATTVRLYDGSATSGTLIGEQSLAEVAPGASTKLSFTWDPVAAAGAHTLTVVADPDRLVFEQDLADNEAAKSVDVTAPRLDLSVETDKPAYGADEAVELAARLTNRSIAERDVRLVMSIRDADDDQVASVHDGQVRIEPNGDAVVDSDWNTRDTTPGRYTVSARLLNAVGDELADATSSFEIEPDVAAGLALETDRLGYGPDDTARIAALVSNRSANSALAGAHVELSLTDPSGAQLDHWDLSAGEVMQGGSVRLDQERSLRGLEPGTYGLSAALLAADGSRLGEATAEFAVGSSADTGDGVRGSLTADPADPYRLTTATFRYSLTNAGNADIEGATVRVLISDLDSGETLKTLDATRTIGRDAPNTGSLSTTADMAEERDYQASLHLVLADGTERALDRAIFHVRPAPFTYGASFDTSARNRVLVWACGGEDEAAARSALGSTFATYVVEAGSEGCSTTGHEQQRRFMRLVRSGDYNQFWILGRHHPLERNTDEELAARVIQGDGLLVAGGHPGFDLNQGGNLSPLGARSAGKVPSSATHSLQFAPGSAFAGLDAQLTSAPAKVTTTQATGIASTSWGNGKTAITATYNQFGRGKAIFVGVAPSAFAERSRAAAVLDEAAGVLLPATGATRAAGMAKLELFVEGHAPGSPLEMRTQLPPGMGSPQRPADVTLAGDLLTVPFDTTGTQRRQRDVWVKLPADAASATTSSAVHYRDAADGQMKRYGDPVTATLDIVENRRTARDAALAALGQIGGSSTSDRATLQKITDDVNAAALETTDAGVLWTRLRALIDDIGTLERARWTNTEPARTAVARLIAYVEYDYNRAGGE